MWGRVFMIASNLNLNPAPQDRLEYVDTCKKRLCIAFQVFTQGSSTFLLETKSVKVNILDTNQITLAWVGSKSFNQFYNFLKGDEK